MLPPPAAEGQSKGISTGLCLLIAEKSNLLQTAKAVYIVLFQEKNKF